MADDISAQVNSDFSSKMAIMVIHFTRSLMATGASMLTCVLFALVLSPPAKIMSFLLEDDRKGNGMLRIHESCVNVYCRR